MTYVRKKKVKGQTYFQLVESKRVNGKPRQRVIMHLSKEPTVDEALESWPKEIARLRRQAKKDGDHYENQPEWLKNERYFKEKFRDPAESARIRADALAARLKKLRNLRKSGVA